MPTANPSTPATTGFVAVEIAPRKSMATRAPSSAEAAKSRMSLPLVKQPPVPVTTMARISASASAAAKAAIRPR